VVASGEGLYRETEFGKRYRADVKVVKRMIVDERQNRGFRLESSSFGAGSVSG